MRSGDILFCGNKILVLLLNAFLLGESWDTWRATASLSSTCCLGYDPTLFRAARSFSRSFLQQVDCSPRFANALLVNSFNDLNFFNFCGSSAASAAWSFASNYNKNRGANITCTSITFFFIHILLDIDT